MQIRMGLRGIACASIAACLWVGALEPEPARADIELYVSPQGNDQASGTRDQPLRTLHAAQERLRQLRTALEEAPAAQVWLSEGVYELDQPLEFTAEDSSPNGTDTLYAALPGEKVVLRGGRRINADKIVLPSGQNNIHASAIDHIHVIDLERAGLDRVETPRPRRGRHQEMHPATIELFSGSKRLPVASWPNSGWAHATHVNHDGLSWPVPASLKLQQPSVDVMAHGFWMHDWQDSCEPVELARSHNGSWQLHFQKEHVAHVGQVREGARYRIEHVLSELDEPGEWYLDRQSHKIYIWPTAEMLAGELFISTLETPVSIYDVSNLTLRGLTIEGARVSAVEIAGGEHVCLDNCLIRHAGNLGVNIYHGSKHRIINCEITSTGAGAIRVEGGERSSLTPCDHSIENCRLHDFAQLQLAYRPAVNVYGVGVSVLGNEVYNAPHSAIILHGNEHRIQRNHIHHVCQETSDVGAVYIGHNPTYRGNKIDHNYLHDLGGFSHTDVMGIYLDDFASGTSVTHNVLVRAGRGVAIGGGRDNLVDNNLFIDCLAAVQIDSRGQTWARKLVEGEHSHLAKCCEEVDISSGAFSERYPELVNLLTDSPEIAKGNRISRNLFEGEIGIDLHDGLNEQLVQLEDNLSGARGLLKEVDEGQYRPQPDSLADKIGFESVGPGKVVLVNK